MLLISVAYKKTHSNLSTLSSPQHHYKLRTNKNNTVGFLKYKRKLCGQGISPVLIVYRSLGSGRLFNQSSKTVTLTLGLVPTCAIWFHSVSPALPKLWHTNLNWAQSNCEGICAEKVRNLILVLEKEFK